MYLQFDLVLSDVSAFLVDGEYHWSQTSMNKSFGSAHRSSFLPVIDRCGVILKLQQVAFSSLYLIFHMFFMWIMFYLLLEFLSQGVISCG